MGLYALPEALTSSEKRFDLRAILPQNILYLISIFCGMSWYFHFHFHCLTWFANEISGSRFMAYRQLWWNLPIPQSVTAPWLAIQYSKLTRMSYSYKNVTQIRTAVIAQALIFEGWVFIQKRGKNFLTVSVARLVSISYWFLSLVECHDWAAVVLRTKTSICWNGQSCGIIN